MIKHFLYLVFISFTTIAFGQSDTNARQNPPAFMLFHLDTMSTPGFSTKTLLNDSISYFLYSEGKVLAKGTYPMGDFRKKGEITRYSTKLNEKGLESTQFYIIKRGFLKGSLTVKINQLNDDNYEISIVSAFATFDKKFSARKGELSEIVVEAPKKLKPGKK